MLSKKYIILKIAHTDQYLTGVNVRVPGFGGTDTIEFLDQELIKLPYFYTVFGYKKGVDIRGVHHMTEDLHQLG